MRFGATMIHTCSRGDSILNWVGALYTTPESAISNPGCQSARVELDFEAGHARLQRIDRHDSVVNAICQIAGESEKAREIIAGFFLSHRKLTVCITIPSSAPKS